MKEDGENAILLHCQFGETVMCKLSQPTTANTNPPWHHAIWLGGDSTANDIIVALDVIFN